jgi:vesicle-associated membrane protein-associated protein A
MRCVSRCHLAVYLPSLTLASCFQKYATVRPNLDGNGHAGVPEFSKSGDALTDHEGDAPHTPPEQPAPPPPVAAAPAPVPQVSPPAPPAPPAVVVVPVTPASPKAAAPGSGVSAEEHADLLTRLAEAQAELQRMRALLQSMPDPSLGGSAPEPSIAPSGSVTEVGLRRRNRALSDASSTMAGSYAGGARSDSTLDRDDRMYKLDAPEGVPIPVVIGVTLGVFVMTYLFF